MNKVLLLFAISLLAGCHEGAKTTGYTENGSEENSNIRWVDDNVIRSTELPEVEIKVNEEFEFLGKFDFEIIANSDEYSADILGKAIASGERYVFSKADSNHDIIKLFIVQFEGFLPENDLIYNYNFDNADFIGENKFRHNTWYYDTKESINDNPNGEWARTISFLKEKGFSLEDHVMMSRFVGLASQDRKNEIIIFYHEMLKSSTGYSLKEWQDRQHTQEIISIDSTFAARSRNSFAITKG